MTVIPLPCNSVIISLVSVLMFFFASRNSRLFPLWFSIPKKQISTPAFDINLGRSLALWIPERLACTAYLIEFSLRPMISLQRFSKHVASTVMLSSLKRMDCAPCLCASTISWRTRSILNFLNLVPYICLMLQNLHWLTHPREVSMTSAGRPNIWNPFFITRLSLSGILRLSKSRRLPCRLWMTSLSWKNESDGIALKSPWPWSCPNNRLNVVSPSFLMIKSIICLSWLINISSKSTVGWYPPKTTLVRLLCFLTNRASSMASQYWKVILLNPTISGLNVLR